MHIGHNIPGINNYQQVLCNKWKHPVMEYDLVSLIEKVLHTNLEPGKVTGIISYNETPLKKIILNGITTISTDFKMMGKKTAEVILSNAREKVAMPFNLTMRKAL